MSTPFCEAEDYTVGDDKRESLTDPAQSETPGMSGNSMRENRETPSVSGRRRPDRLEKATSYTTSMNAGGESDSAVVPAKCPNKGGVPAEGMEGRALAKKIHDQDRTCRTPSRRHRGLGLVGERQSLGLPPSFEAGAVCAKVRPYGSVRGAVGNRRPYRD